MPLVTSGVEKGNLRELALARMDDLGLKCRDVRTREAGIQVLHLSSLDMLFIKSSQLFKLFVNLLVMNIGHTPQN